MALLLREALGDSLRRARVSQSRTLREVSTTARVSLGYLSEVERGRKEASSELLAAICTALDVPLADVLSEASDHLAGVDQLAGAGAAQPVPEERAGVPAAAEEAAMATASDSAMATMSVASASPAVPRIVQDTRIVIPAPSTRAFVAA